jgi:hypothetical protein
MNLKAFASVIPGSQYRLQCELVDTIIAQGKSEGIAMDFAQQSIVEDHVSEYFSSLRRKTGPFEHGYELAKHLAANQDGFSFAELTALLHISHRNITTVSETPTNGEFTLRLLRNSRSAKDTAGFIVRMLLNYDQHTHLPTRYAWNQLVDSDKTMLDFTLSPSLVLNTVDCVEASYSIRDRKWNTIFKERIEEVFTPPVQH